MWRCLHCGVTMDGDIQPSHCSICGSDRLFAEWISPVSSSFATVCACSHVRSSHRCPPQEHPITACNSQACSQCDCMAYSQPSTTDYYVHCNHANEVPSICTCADTCPCRDRERGWCRNRCVCGHEAVRHRNIYTDGHARCTAPCPAFRRIAEGHTRASVASEAAWGGMQRVRESVSVLGASFEHLAEATRGMQDTINAMSGQMAQALASLEQLARQGCLCGHAQTYHKAGVGACIHPAARTGPAPADAFCACGMFLPSQANEVDDKPPRAIRVRE